MAPTKRPHPRAAADTDSIKRRRTDVNDAPTAIVSFNKINNDCKVHILSFLPAEDMNSFAICDRDCRRLRTNDSLDQTRTATIVFSETTTATSFLDLIRLNKTVFIGNRTRLKIEGLEKISKEEGSFDDALVHMRLLGVTSLDCSLKETERVNDVPFRILSQFLPNLQEFDLSSVAFSIIFWLRRALPQNCPGLSKITWKRSKQLFLCGLPYESFTNLTHLDLDESVFYTAVYLDDGQYAEASSEEPSTNYLLMKCRGLQYLSIKGAAQIEFRLNDTQEPDWWNANSPLSQEFIINMVRRHPSLQWLRSDLTADNTAMLKRERPDITFVSD